MHTPIIKSTYGHFQFPPQTDSRIKDKLDTDLVDKEYQKMKKKGGESDLLCGQDQQEWGR